jgi:hypothetical protein
MSHTTLQSITVRIFQSTESVYNFLSDFNNFGSLMPEQVESFSSDGNSCTFTIKGMATLSLQYESRIPNSLIRMKSVSTKPFGFALTCNISNAGDESDLQLILEAELNPFLKMMAEKPLTNFLNILVSKYQQIANSAG